MAKAGPRDVGALQHVLLHQHQLCVEHGGLQLYVFAK